jgi:predicted XRE-type DNA-binding protein
MTEPITESTGNVFADLGFEPAEASILQLRAELMCDLRTYVAASGMTNEEAAQKFGISPSRLEDLIRGRWEKFSLESLVALEARAGRKLKIELAA